jgi:kynurenine formamidase
MCDACNLGRGWQGWNAVPIVAVSGDGGWTDLTHTLSEKLSFPGKNMPPASIRRVKSLPGDFCNMTEIRMVVHFGTHVDAPRHFYDDGPAMQDIPLERLMGPGVIWKIDAGRQGVIDVPDLEKARPRARPGDIIVFDTGWGAKMGTPEYDDNPSLSPAAAQWLVDHQIKLVGIDCTTPDLAINQRGPDFDFPVHRTLLSQGVLIAEHVANAPHLANRRVEFIVGALSIEGSDGAPVRLMAREIDQA